MPVSYHGLTVAVHPWWQWQPTPVFLLENPLDRGAWRAAVHGVTQSRQLKRAAADVLRP